MPTTSKIRSITPGNSFVFKNGPMAGQTAFTFKVLFEDNVVGEANSKSANPPYAVGDMVEYESTPGQYGNKLKIKKVGGFTGQLQPGVTPAKAQQGQSQPQQGASKQWGGANVGMRTGMAINAATAWLKDKPVDLTTEAGRILFRKHASFFFHEAEKIENGDTEPAKPTEAPKPELPIPTPEPEDNIPF